MCVLKLFPKYLLWNCAYTFNVLYTWLSVVWQNVNNIGYLSYVEAQNEKQKIPDNDYMKKKSYLSIIISDHNQMRNRTGN